MTWAVEGPGSEPTPEELNRAQYVHELVATALPRVRATALAWRNGIAGLFTAAAGFTLIHGRSDVGELRPVASYVVGGLLLGGFVVAGAAAVRFLRAAHGMPSIVRVDTLAARVVSEQDEARASILAVRAGQRLACLSAALIASAIGLTWYGPARSQPQLVVGIGDGQRCGEVEVIEGGTLRLKTGAGSTSIALSSITSMQPTGSCP